MRSEVNEFLSDLKELIPPRESDRDFPFHRWSWTETIMIGSTVSIGVMSICSLIKPI